MSELHAVQSNLLLKLFNGLIGELEAQLNNDYAISSKNILALGRVWGIVREACDVKDDFRLQDSKKTCQNMRSCCVKANHGYANNMSVNGPGSESVAITSSRRGSTTSAVAASYGSNLDALGQQEAQTLLIARYLPALPPQLSNLTKMVSEVFSNPSHRTPVQQSRSISAVASPPSMALSAAGTGLEMKDVPLSTPTAMSLSITVSSPHATVSVAGTPHQAPIEAFASIVNQLDRPQMAQAFSIFQQRSRALALPEEIVSGAAAV